MNNSHDFMFGLIIGWGILISLQLAWLAFTRFLRAAAEEAQASKDEPFEKRAPDMEPCEVCCHPDCGTCPNGVFNTKI